MGSFIYSQCGDEREDASSRAEDKGLRREEERERKRERKRESSSTYTYANAARGMLKRTFMSEKGKARVRKRQPWQSIKCTNDRFIDFQFSMSHDMSNGDLSVRMLHR